MNTDPTNTRLIPKSVECPRLSQEAWQLITRLCFRPDNLVGSSDALFVFGTLSCVAHAALKVKDLLSGSGATLFPCLVISGGIPQTSEDTAGISEARMIYDAIGDDVTKMTEVYLEEKSRNTRENVEMSLDRLPQYGGGCIVFVSNSVHARRAYLTLRHFFPLQKSVTILQQTWTYVMPDGFRVTSSSWFENEVVRNLVWGEVLRIDHYTNIGHLADDPETTMLLRRLKIVLGEHLFKWPE